MTVKRVTVDRPLFKLGMTLGEGCVWDTRTQRLYFIDIDQCKVYTYEPSSGIIGFETFDTKVTALALLESGNGLLATIDTGFALMAPADLPFPPTDGKVVRQAQPIGPEIPLGAKEKRFNDAAVDPAGRFLGGTMGYKGDEVVGQLYSLQKASKGTDAYLAPLVLGGITCTNGMGWTADGKTMYLTDSWTRRIDAYDYDVATGAISNQRIFSQTSDDKYGEPDGLCMDSEGGVWSARWESGLVVRFDPQGNITDEVVLPTVWCATCVVFGGEGLDELYVTTADTGYNGAVIPERYDGGNLFVVKGLGYTGVERGRFKDV